MSDRCEEDNTLKEEVRLKDLKMKTLQDELARFKEKEETNKLHADEVKKELRTRCEEAEKRAALAVSSSEIWKEKLGAMERENIRLKNEIKEANGMRESNGSGENIDPVHESSNSGTVESTSLPSVSALFQDLDTLTYSLRGTLSLAEEKIFLIRSSKNRK